MRKKIIFILFLTINYSNILSQELIGKITDIQNKPINAVKVFTKDGISSSTDSRGEYILKLSNILTGGNILFYLSSIIGLFMLFYISRENLLRMKSMGLVGCGNFRSTDGMLKELKNSIFGKKKKY